MAGTGDFLKRIAGYTATRRARVLLTSSSSAMTWFMRKGFRSNAVERRRPKVAGSHRGAGRQGCREGWRHREGIVAELPKSAFIGCGEIAAVRRGCGRPQCANSTHSSRARRNL